MHFSLGKYISEHLNMQIYIIFSTLVFVSALTR